MRCSGTRNRARTRRSQPTSTSSRSAACPARSRNGWPSRRRNLMPLPAGFSFVEAACLPVAYLTAYRMLFNRAGLRPGQSVLVQGAGGGVATAALLLGKAAGLVVYVTSRSEEKRAHALEIGAAGAFAPGSRLPASGRCRARLGRQGDLGSLAEVAADGRYGRRRGSDERPGPVRRSGTDVLAPAHGPSVRRSGRVTSSERCAPSSSRPE